MIRSQRGALCAFVVLVSCGEEQARSTAAGGDLDGGADRIEPVDAPEDAPGSDSADSTSDGRVEDPPLPDALPFDFSRPAAGEPVSSADVTAFTRRLTALFRDVDLFQWFDRNAFGADASVGPEFVAWWTYYEADKVGDEVTYRMLPSGVPDNLMGPTAELLSSMASAYLLTSDPTAGRVTELLAKGVSAQFLGMVYGEDDPIRHVMARAVMVRDHSVDLGGGLAKRIDFSAWRYADDAGNTQSFLIPDNPFWGPIWVRNIRSKDDVGQLYRAAGVLRWVARDAASVDVRDAARTADEDMRRFARAVVDHGFRIPARDENGAEFLPNGDLASFVQYQTLVPDAECSAKLSTSLLAGAGTGGIDCGEAFGSAYETVAVATNAYNVGIIRRFHLAAILYAILGGENDAARALLDGLVKRVERDTNLAAPPGTVDPVQWDRELAIFLLRAGATGLPLTSDEVRFVHSTIAGVLDELEPWPYWDLWSSSIPDGTYPPQPFPAIGMWDLVAFFDLCASRSKNPSGEPVVDCAVLADTARWGG